MNRYLFVVYGPSADTADDRAAGMALMAEWYRSLGAALVDPGAPFITALTVSDSGVGAAVGPNATGGIHGHRHRACQDVPASEAWRAGHGLRDLAYVNASRTGRSVSRPLRHYQLIARLGACGKPRGVA